MFYPLVTYYRTGRPTQDVLSTIDRDEFKNLLKYKLQTLDMHFQKYFNIEYWMRLNVQRAMILGLQKTKNQSILDIGAGFGYFPYVARFYNHNVIGIDLPGDKLFEKSTEFFELDIRHIEIKPMTPLPDLGQKFDLITSFQVCFHGHRSENVWGEKEWRFFLEDIYENHMNPGGCIYFELNYEPSINKWLPNEVKRLFKKEYNARYWGYSRVMLHKKVK